jgi:beta-glucosidase
MTGATVGIPQDESSLVARLDLEQKVRLLTGRDSWVLYGEPAIGLRQLVVSDGPAGVRGRKFDAANPSSSLPCPIALGATWDVHLIEEVAHALGLEARFKGVDVLLGPTVNLVRTPLSGRGFECFSEDPLLSSLVAAAYVRGVQKAGVGATAKHYVANDSETERRTYDAQVAEGVLRELYLPPFEACVAEGVLMVMAAYNSVNGETMTSNARLLDLLKHELGFTGVVVSDWHAASSTVASALAGLDLVMPGPDGPWGDRLVAAVRDGSVPEAAVDAKVERLIALARRVGALDGGVDGNGAGPKSDAQPAIVDPTLLRTVAARSFVLLSNPRGLLPLPSTVARIALIGPNAIEPQTQGGGSVRVLPVVRPGIAEGLADALDAYVTVDQGCVTAATIASPAAGTFYDPVTDRPGVRLEVTGPDGATLYDAPFAKTVVTWWDGLPAEVHRAGSRITMRTRYRVGAGGPHVIGAAGIGRLKVLVDGVAVADETTQHPTRDVVFVLSRPPEVRTIVELKTDQEVEVRVEHSPDVHGRQAGFVTMRLGIAPDVRDEDLIDNAVRAAAAAQVAVVVVGSADGTESEGYDRDTLALPGRQDELVSRVAVANPNTVVVVNSGTPVLMPWVDQVAGVIQAWFPGQAFGEALADVLAGKAEPSGRLPVTIGRAASDWPVLLAHPDGGRLPYSEGLLIGYRGYDRNGTEPLFAFGHGLGYTEWTYQSISPASAAISAGQDLEITVRLRNAGARAGREVVQLYVEPPVDDRTRPLRTLAAVAAVAAAPGEVVEAKLHIGARSFQRFDERAGRWESPSGTYTLRAGRSSKDLKLSSKVVMR